MILDRLFAHTEFFQIPSFDLRGTGMDHLFGFRICRKDQPRTARQKVDQFILRKDLQRIPHLRGHISRQHPVVPVLVKRQGNPVGCHKESAFILRIRFIDHGRDPVLKLLKGSAAVSHAAESEPPECRIGEIFLSLGIKDHKVIRADDGIHVMHKILIHQLRIPFHQICSQLQLIDHIVVISLFELIQLAVAGIHLFKDRIQRPRAGSVCIIQTDQRTAVKGSQKDDQAGDDPEACGNVSDPLRSITLLLPQGQFFRPYKRKNGEDPVYIHDKADQDDAHDR